MNYQYLPIFLLLPLLGVSFYFGYTPLLLSALFGIVSVITFVIYYKDKSAAISGSWRTRESTLHMLSLLCGWPGAIVAQQTLRHKTQKQSFRFIFWLTVLMNVAAFLWLHTPEGSKLLRSSLYRFDSVLAHNAGLHMVSGGMLQLTRFNE